MWRLLILFVVCRLATALETTTCDCRSANQTSLLDVAEKCTVSSPSVIFTQVRYWVYTNEPILAEVKAIISARWTRRRMTVTRRDGYDNYVYPERNIQG